jgi:hypothetical protein
VAGTAGGGSHRIGWLAVTLPQGTDPTGMALKQLPGRGAAGRAYLTRTTLGSGIVGVRARRALNERVGRATRPQYEFGTWTTAESPEVDMPVIFRVPRQIVTNPSPVDTRTTGDRGFNLTKNDEGIVPAPPATARIWLPDIPFLMLSANSFGGSTGQNHVSRSVSPSTERSM